MVDETTSGEFCKILRMFLCDGQFSEVKALLEKGELLALVDEKYSDWLKNQNSIVQSFENGQEILHHKEKTVAIFEALVQCCQTIISGREGWGKEEIIHHKEQVSVALTACKYLLSSLYKRVEERDTATAHSYWKFVIKKVACCLVFLCASNSEEHSWTSPESRLLACEILSFICIHCHCSSIAELLTGDSKICPCGDFTDEFTPEDTSAQGQVFPSGLFSHVFDYLRPNLLRETWKKSPMACPALVWCTMQLKYPYVSDHFGKLMSPLLLLIDDYEVKNKVMGLRCVRHIVENMNSAELGWFGRADVFYEAIQRHLYTSEPSVATALYPCLISILKVVEFSPTKPKFGRKTVLTSMEFESKIAMRRVCSSHLKHFIQHMGITTLRHFKRLLRVIFSYLEVSDYPNEEARLEILDTLHTTMVYAWPRIPHHSSSILKSLLKLQVDVKDSAPHLTAQAYQQLNEKISECLFMLLMCCGTPVEEQLRGLTKGVGHKEVEDCIFNVLGKFRSETS
ncbi:TELO2-interacting protein 2-like isoform X2 [Acropora millepora]|uniref:TELO2-interacting protein 2-like isoform X2 n=1 Tax=Acropora millepora TaxID=45264 RepID=UPI001CF5517B|nr:TELO2-interacting protein 2-like isoform X2 [Acropora millepora]